jgi:hypothetical protein
MSYDNVKLILYLIIIKVVICLVFNNMSIGDIETYYRNFNYTVRL